MRIKEKNRQDYCDNWMCIDYTWRRLCAWMQTYRNQIEPWS